MRRCLKRTIYCLVPALAAAVVLGVPTAAPDLGLQNVNLSCNDRTNLNLALDPGSLTALTNAVGAINLYPAGDPALACGLQTSASGSPSTDYAVGGGRATLFACTVGSNFLIEETNFALNARVDTASNGSAGTGTFNVTIPQSQAAGCDPPGNQEGHFTGRIDCVNVISPSMAQATFAITMASGSFSGSEGQRLTVNVFDSGLPGGTGDRIRLRPSFGRCLFGAFTATRSVDNGNLSIHQAS
jgi:hypothetical protein